MIEDLKKYGEVIEDVDLTNYNTYKIKSTAKYLVKPYTIDDLVNLIKYIKNNNLKRFILGGGSNVILSSNFFDGIIIKLDNLNEVEINDCEVKVGAGIMFNKFSLDMINNNLKGLEWSTGIPGTIGGSIVSNAGAYNAEMSDFIKEVYALGPDLSLITLKKDEIDYGYRTTIFKKNKDYIVVGATLVLHHGTKEASMELVQDRFNRRISSQPLEYPSAGSVFRNPSADAPAGKLIEDSGFKNTHINDAYVSEKHANFIINKGKASSNDIIELINKVHAKVLVDYNIDLKLEQEIVNW